MQANSNSPALRKRTQISRANRTMFVWVAGASVVVGFAVVISIFLWQKLVFNEKVLAQKDVTINNLTLDNNNVKQLKDNVRALDANQALASVKANPTDQALQVVLDALPSSANSLAFGASLQQKLLAGIDGLTVNSIQVDPVPGAETLSGSTDTSSGAVGSGDASQNAITFTMQVNGSQDVLKQVLQRLEASIRTVHVDTIHIENITQMTVSGEVYYEPAVNLTLQSKVVRP